MYDYIITVHPRALLCVVLGNLMLLLFCYCRGVDFSSKDKVTSGNVDGVLYRQAFTHDSKHLFNHHVFH